MGLQSRTRLSNWTELNLHLLDEITVIIAFPLEKLLRGKQIIFLVSWCISNKVILLFYQQQKPSICQKLELGKGLVTIRETCKLIAFQPFVFIYNYFFCFPVVWPGTKCWSKVYLHSPNPRPHLLLPCRDTAFMPVQAARYCYHQYSGYHNLNSLLQEFSALPAGSLKAIYSLPSCHLNTLCKPSPVVGSLSPAKILILLRKPMKKCTQEAVSGQVTTSEKLATAHISYCCGADCRSPISSAWPYPLSSAVCQHEIQAGEGLWA